MPGALATFGPSRRSIHPGDDADGMIRAAEVPQCCFQEAKALGDREGLGDQGKVYLVAIIHGKLAERWLHSKFFR